MLAKLMCTAPQKITKAVLEVPSAINNALPVGSAKLMVPLIRYCLTKEDKYIRQTALYMDITPDVLDEDTLATVKISFTHVKTKAAMPSNVGKSKMRRYTAPALILAAERDCLFPARKVLKRAKEILPQTALYELKARGHMHHLTDREKTMIIQFLK